MDVVFDKAHDLMDKHSCTTMMWCGFVLEMPMDLVSQNRCQHRKTLWSCFVFGRGIICIVEALVGMAGCWGWLLNFAVGQYLYSAPCVS